ncbi:MULTISPECIES: A24 family peptidase [unclassified Gordonia (in: high G+C Gram-positive bacteria)]|uniref:A24 family peptidase n=1 Tax=unclassified Gordonia (in: high G+C Gram-positive bacteria) TaxID=2657482 RepID=UPI001F0E5073|nr:A24 family peptidase [Gordonia sp. ABSL49_1]MCH5643540.1 A24 family peptidase [Gordonia sp. ABSL49_1]
MASWAVLIWLVSIGEHDRRTRRIPNVLVWPGICAVSATAVVHPQVGVAAAVALTPYLWCHRAGWCGGGDVKLALVCGGLAAHWDAALVLVAVAALTNAGAFALRRGGAAGAHGPFLVAATIVIAGPW